MVGARSALFAPFSDLGLIVIDEEHESSLQAGVRAALPRARRRRAAGCGAPAPSLVLGQRKPLDGGARTLRVGRVDARRAARARDGPARCRRSRSSTWPPSSPTGTARCSRGRCSPRSQGVASAGEKAVLFLNRRGFASLPAVPRVRLRARVRLLLDLADLPRGRRAARVPPLRRHAAGARRRARGAAVPTCASSAPARSGSSPSSRRCCPDLPVVRMDADTTKGKGGHERALAQFEALDAGVLLGTQMIAKGLDYPEVTLVGVINADTTLHLPDFRAGERTYQLLEQVAGRAGRGERPGRVIVQTYWPDHPAIRAAALHEPRRRSTTEEETAARGARVPAVRPPRQRPVLGRDKAAVAAQAAATGPRSSTRGFPTAGRSSGRARRRSRGSRACGGGTCWSRRPSERGLAARYWRRSTRDAA